eukprot:4542328-Prorocentrum_lima.AAC.1
MYPWRPPTPLIDLTQHTDDDAPVVRPEDPPEDDDMPDFNADVHMPAANQEACTGAASSAAAPVSPLPRPPAPSTPAVSKPLPP